MIRRFRILQAYSFTLNVFTILQGEIDREVLNKIPEENSGQYSCAYSTDEEDFQTESSDEDNAREVNVNFLTCCRIAKMFVNH